MNFNFNEISSQALTKPTLAPNVIHTVIFDGCEARDFTGSTGDHKVIDIKFHSTTSEAEFVHTIWQPKEDDWKETTGNYGPNPSNVCSMVYLCKHLIDAVNPEIAEKLNTGELQFNIDESKPESSWNALRTFMVENTKAGIGKETKIKLLANNKGESKFPGFFMAYSKAGKLYMKTNFIGDNIFFTSKELSTITAAKKATPTPVTNTMPEMTEMPKAAPAPRNVDFNLDI